MKKAGQSGGWIWPSFVDEGWYSEINEIDAPNINTTLSNKRRTVYNFEH